MPVSTRADASVQHTMPQGKARPTVLFIALGFVFLVFAVTGAMADNGQLKERAFGVQFIALPKDPKKTFDTKLLTAPEGLKRLKAAMEELISKSPFSAKKIELLKKDGEVTLVYLPGDAPKSAATGENVAVFLPNFLSKGASRQKSYLVVVGRHGIKWPKKELAAILAHELVGHGVQFQRGRIRKVRPIDLECEAYLYEELANQDLALDKRTTEMVRFRKALERRWCADFKAYMRKYTPNALKIWDTLNPEIPKLLSIFERYIRATAK